LSYSSKTSTSFVLTGTVSGNFITGTRVEIAFALPSDYMSNIGLMLDHKIKVKFRKYDDIFEYLNSFKSSLRSRNYRQRTMFDDPYQTPPFYSIKDAEFILLYNIGQTGDELWLRYEKLPTSMSADSDLITIDDDDYAKMFLAYWATGEILWNRQEEDSGANYFNVGITYAREMYDMYIRQGTEKMSGKHYDAQK